MELKTKQKIKRILAKLYYPAYWLDKLINTQPKFIILVYHSINPDHPFSVHPKNFEEQIKFLISNYKISTPEDFFNFKEDTIVITFDDGYEDNFYYAMPILKKYNCPATFFICTGFVNKEIDITKNGVYQDLRPLSWDQIKEMQKEGMNFGPHTHSHPILSKISLEKAHEEIKKSRKILEDILKSKIAFFAYPLGQKNTFNKKITTILKKEGFQLACSTIWGENFINTNPFMLKRIRIDPSDNFDDFKRKIKGEWDFIKWFHLLK